MPTRPLVEHAHHHVEATVHLAQQRIAAQTDVREIERADLARPLAHLVFLGAALDALGMQIHDEDGHAAVTRFLVGPSQNKARISDRRVMDPDLTAIEDPAVPVAHGGGADAGDVSPGLGLRDTVSDLAFHGENVGQHLLLLRRSVTHEKCGDQLHQTALVGHAGIAAGQFFHHDRIGQRIESRSTEFFGHSDAEQAQLAHFFIDFCREALLTVQRLGGGTDDVIHERPCRFADFFLHFVQKHSRLHISN